LAGVALGLGLVALAVPRTVAAWEAMPANRALSQFSKATPAELRDGIAGLTRAVTWIASGRYLSNLGTLELLLAETMTRGDPARDAVLANAEGHLMAGLAADPLDGLDWYRLAEVRNERGTNRRLVVTALMKSLDVAPNMRNLWLNRTLGLLRDRQYLTPDELAALNSQIRRVWPADGVFSRQMAAALKADPASLDALRRALDGDPQSLDELSVLLKAQQ
jgi:hypothetical protein